MKSKSIYQKLWSVLSDSRIHLILTAVFGVAGGILSLLVPILIGDAVDCVLGADAVSFDPLQKILLRLAIAVVAGALMQWGMHRCANRLALRTVRTLRYYVFEKLGKVPVSYIDRQPRGEVLQTAVNDAELISDGLIQGLASLLSGIVTIIGTFVMMLTINVPIALLVVLLTPISMLAAGGIAKRCHNSFAVQSKLRGSLSSFAEEEIGNMELVQAFCGEETAQKRQAEISQQLCDAGIRATFFSALVNPTTRFVNSLLYAAVGTVGALAAAELIPALGVITVGELTAFLTYCNQYTKPFNEISGVIAELQNALASAKRVFDVIEAEAEPSDEDLPVLSHTDGSIAFDDVSFSYTPEQKLLQNITLSIPDGQKVAVVGPTGCGKTTLINLLLRFYEPKSGTIALSGQPIAGCTRDSVREAYGMVLQDTWLFGGTVAENIAYGRENATREEIIAAAKEVRAHGFIKRLPQGYDTVISMDSLSQGQRQLLSVARVLLTDPEILILDEATSSIDLRTEVRVRQAFDRLTEGRTSIMIAHRLATIRNADLILVMKDGNIIEHGTHDALVRKDGFYAGLYRSQFAGQAAQ
ncbi:MAG: ABC transporter ATP-binding protein [Ruminococcus sp.]|nr:ABC transporter ATP-binding protein [Ruminococcus sp.]